MSLLQDAEIALGYLRIGICRFDSARNGKGDSVVPWSSEALSWCSTGACCRASEEPGELILAFTSYLEKILPMVTGVPDWHDDNTDQVVLKTWEDFIEDLKGNT